MNAQSVICMLCATRDTDGEAVHRIEEAFPDCLLTRGNLVPEICVGTAVPLRSVARRYEGAAPYGGPAPAQLWGMEVRMGDRVEGPQRLRELVMRLHDDGLLLDHEVWLPSAPDPDIRP